jgi:hypothetical protein
MKGQYAKAEVYRARQALMIFMLTFASFCLFIQIAKSFLE